MALLACGSISNALEALLALSGTPLPPIDKPKERAQAYRSVPEAWSLLGFSISDSYFDLREAARESKCSP